ncbi:hypothetical protein M0R45_001149 [Rubus argutus]|uniref:Uncharacterized protein n=1 Tax=Rubus argutus TaxID=59490 RepID=A0AAW1VLH7_RUBAR
MEGADLGSTTAWRMVRLVVHGWARLGHGGDARVWARDRTANLEFQKLAAMGFFIFFGSVPVVAAALFFSLIAAAAWFDHGGWLDYGWAFVMVSEGRAGALCTGSDVWLFWVLLDHCIWVFGLGEESNEYGQSFCKVLELMFDYAACRASLYRQRKMTGWAPSGFCNGRLMGMD